VVELLAVAGDEQQRVVGAGTEHEHRHDRARLAVDRHAQLGDAVADRARQDLGEDDRDQRDEEEHRRPVDHDQQEDHQAERSEEQRPVDPFEDFDRVGGEAGAAGDLRFEARALIGDRLAPILDRVDDPFALAFGVDVGGDDRGLAVLRADRADERGVAAGLAGDRGGGGGTARRAAGRDGFLLAPGLPPDAAVSPSGTTPSNRFAVIWPTSASIVLKSAGVRPAWRRKTITAGAISPPCSCSVAASAFVDSADSGR
jgi:hypothetical protein